LIGAACAVGGPPAAPDKILCRKVVAGDAVLIAPVSSQNPCEQGILQGNSRNSASRTTIGGREKPVSQRLFAEFPTTVIRENIL
jgi:hypothetical protein